MTAASHACRDGENDSTSNHLPLPEHPPCQGNSLRLGNLNAEDTARVVTETYYAAGQFRPNTFRVPRGYVGKDLISMLSEYLEWFGNSTPYADQALMLAMVFQQLMLQKPHKAPEPRYVKCLQHRI